MKKNELFDNFINDSLSESEYNELLEKLEDEGNSEKFVDYLVETNLMLAAAENIQEHQAPVTAKQPIMWKVISIVALLIFSFIIFSPQKVKFEVIASSGAQYTNGQVIDSSAVKLTEGSLSLKMTDGTQLDLKAPVDLEVVSSQKLKLNEGTLSVRLTPNVQSFEVLTPLGSVKDLGTAFGIRLEDDSALLSVYDGKVLLQLVNQQTEVTAGNALRFTQDSFQPELYTNDVALDQKLSLFSLGERQLRPGESMDFKLDASAKTLKTKVSMQYDKDVDFLYKLVATADGTTVYESSQHSALDTYEIDIPVDALSHVQITLKAISGTIQNGLLKMQEVELVTDGYRPYEGNYLIPAQSEWSYKFKSPPEAEWMQVNFNDEHWLKGRASLGYGDYDLKTRIGPDDLNKTISRIYLRKVFDLDNIELGDMTHLTLNLLADDGADIYLNGQELKRYNVSDGPVSKDTHALKRANRKTGEIIYNNFTLPVDQLIQGKNVISVILYQVKKKSSDMRFDLQLKVY